MEIAEGWKDYKIIATANGMKLERWKDVVLLRPDPQVIWKGEDLSLRGGIHAVYRRSSSGGGSWEKRAPFPDEWTVSYKDLTFKVKPMGFKHTGLFPEQAVNWDKLRALISAALASPQNSPQGSSLGSGKGSQGSRGSDENSQNPPQGSQGSPQNSPRKEIKVLNLFAYTGGASVACAKAGALVTHVDAAKGMVERAGENARLSGVDRGIRYIVDDCSKFVAREIRRGNRYDGIIMDPPSYGRGPGGETWKIEDDLFGFVKECSKLLSEKPLFMLINSYTTGLQPAVISNILKLALAPFRGEVKAYEVGIATEEGIPLPCGASGLFTGEGYGD